MRYGGSLRFLLGPLLLLPLRFPLPRVLQPYTSISERLLSRGLAVVYRQVPAGARGETRARAARTPVSPPPPPARALRFAQGGAQYDGPLERWNRLEARAKAKRLGVWRQKGGFESPAEYKRRQRG